MNTQMTPREKMWRAARCVQVFSVEDLAVLACSNEREAGAFVKCLRRRGYVQFEAREVRARRGRPLAKFRLINNPGPRLPDELRGRKPIEENHDSQAA